jgi:hypothetical protein
VPITALGVAENETVTVHVGLHGLLVNVAVTPEGSPDAEKVTGAVVPLTRIASIDEERLVEPATTVKLFGDGVERLKSNDAGATVKDKKAEWLAPPPVASILTRTVPKAAVAVAENETVTVHVGLQGLFVKITVTPVGRPKAEKVIAVVVPLTNVASTEDEGLEDP